MACVKNVKNVIKSVRGTINPYYDCLLYTSPSPRD